MVATVVDRGVVRVTGPDAAGYLQGQVSQDVDSIAVGSSAWSLILQPTGKLIAWFRVHRIGDAEFVLDVDPESVVGLIARLERFTLRTDVEFMAEPGWRMLSSRGGRPRAGEQVADGRVADELPGGGELVAEFTWPGFSGIDRLGPSLEVGGAAVDNEAFEEARIRAAVPRTGVDLDDDTIPAEGGAALIDMTVSFTKGCYTGQELVARIDSRGANVPRPLRVLEAAVPLAVGANIRFAGADVGVVSSSQATVALARVLRKVPPGAVVDVDGIAATVLAPPGFTSLDMRVPNDPGMTVVADP